MCYLTQKVSAGGDWPLSVSLQGRVLWSVFSVRCHDGLYCEAELHLQSCFCCERQDEAGELPFPVVTAVLNLGFDECY